MFKIHIDGLDGSLNWGKPTLAEAIEIATGELRERRPPVNANITDSDKEQMVWEGSKSPSGAITARGIKPAD
jgi:hypothetical protein